jgi:hypothetical protein
MRFFDDILQMIRDGRFDFRTFSGEERYGRIRKRRFLFIAFILFWTPVNIIVIAIFLSYLVIRFILKQNENNSNTNNNIKYNANKNLDDESNSFHEMEDDSEDIPNYNDNNKQRDSGNNHTYQTYEENNFNENSFNENPNRIELEKFQEYKDSIDNLKIRYQNKEDITKKIIKERFQPSQVTYDKFMNEINSWNTIFIKQSNLALNIIDMAPEYTQKVEDGLSQIVNRLKSIVEKMEELTVELTLSRKTDTEEVKELLSEMQKVIDSVKEYS